MMKSRQIQLVLITAALASCNRAVVPQMPVTNKADPTDSSLRAGPVYNGDPYSNTFNLCCQEAYSQLWNYSFSPLGCYYIGPVMNAFYHPGRLYRKSAFWKKDHFIVRGGWGKSGSSAGS